jgi:class 3 adenylate cyclase/tetratricopeptide (TPR) repeat protein
MTKAVHPALLEISMSYNSNPPDHPDREIPPDLLELVEQMAESTHNVWSRQRLAEGWKYGPQRDDVKKEHPGLVPYQDLPESEKEYDRKISLGTIKTILAWGYRIDSPSRKASPGRTAMAPGEAAAFRPFCEDLSRLDLHQTLRLWQTLKSLGRGFPERIHQDLGHHLLRLGEPLLAYDIVSEGLKARPQDTRLRQLLALALLRSGAIQQALDLLQKLSDEGLHDEETMGLMARACKDLAIRATDLTAKSRQWRQAYKIYASTYEQTGGYWTGINAATIARCLGEKEKATVLADKVAAQCLKELSGQGGDGGERYWLEATLGEAALIREQWDEAVRWYTKACRTAKRRYGDLASTRRNARFLFDVMELAPSFWERLESCFRIPAVVVFAGHMIDQPGRPRRRFPGYLAEQVSQKIAETLDRLDAKIGFASAACGSDILFLEAMLEREGEINIILPYKIEEFIKTSVTISPGADWGSRFEAVLARATRVIIASENRASGNAMVYEYANLLLDGLAMLRAKMLDTELIPLVVWDGGVGDGPGGTSSQIHHWRSHGLEPEIIDISRLLAETPPLGPGEAAGPPSVSREGLMTCMPLGFTEEIRAMLFADVVESSKIMDEQVPIFVAHFMGAVNELLAESPQKPLLKNTWGDALYCVFASVQDGGNFALQLRDLVCHTDWQEKGLPKEINLRISLHAGPVYCYKEPFFKELEYAGSHITRAARIETITPPGQVYASQQFAALASTQRVRDFTCEYVGRIPLPKQSGIIPLYLVRRLAP